MDLSKYISIRENWPKEGVSFKDITPLLMDKDAFRYTIDKMCKPFVDSKIDKIVCADARGFIFASAMAYILNCGVIIARKKGKLPHVGASETYNLEYGTATLETPSGAFNKGENILIVDDLLATGGSAKAMTNIVNKSGANISGYSFLIELTDLNGRRFLAKAPIYSLITYNI